MKKTIRRVVSPTPTVDLYLTEEHVPKILKSQARKKQPYVVRVATTKYGKQYARKMMAVSWWHKAVVKNRFGEITYTTEQDRP